MFGNKTKVVLVGTGMVGMSFAYATLNQNVCDELVLIDINEKRANGEAMDLNHGLAFSHSSMKIYSGSYQDCSDAEIVAICAGVNQKPGESRLQLLKRNAMVFESIVPEVVQSGFDGIFLVATNPVDIMTRITYELSGFNAAKVIGTGTTLDTARLRYLLGEYFEVDPRNIHAYVIGEHGNSEFVPWSQALLAPKPIKDVLRDNPQSYYMEDLDRISAEVRSAAQKIIEAKGATYYGIGMAMVRIVHAILRNENSALTVSARLRGEYGGKKDVFIGNPCILNSGGAKRILELKLTEDELEKLTHCCDILNESFKSLDL
ncbi:MAG: L-lactate dehydrogenase [Clostridiales bacterium]|nr:L-lactate dehydrogenase [Clostridiales bacterium]